MATTWIKPTYAHKRYQRKAAISRKIAYAIRDSKTALHDENDGQNNIEQGQGLEFTHENESVETSSTNLAAINALSTVNNYIQNPAKTKESELVTGYECFPELAAEQFSTTMDLYERNTGRTHKDNSRLIYHLRQSFALGEVDPRIANKIGCELALEFTKGQHAFICATHTDRPHIHNHIIVCAFNLEADGKFKDPWFSGKRDVARISDKLCREYGLSVVEHKQGWGLPYHKWEKQQGITQADKEPTKRERLEEIISLCLEKQPKDFNRLLKYLEDDYSCVIRRRGKNISVLTPFSKNPFRLNSLSDDFTEAGIKRHIAEQQRIANVVLPAVTDTDENNQNTENIGNSVHDNIDSTHAIYEPTLVPSKPKTTKPKTSTSLPKPKPKLKSELRLIIDIQNSLKATENIGYKKWAEKFNLEQMSQTLIFIEKHQLTLGELQNMAEQKPKIMQNIKAEIGVIEDKLQQISQLQRHIGTYGKTKDIYKQYKQSGSSEHFKQENHKAIADHEAARAYFDERGYGFASGNRLPQIKELREEYAVRNTEKKVLWAKYHEIKNADKEIENAWANVKTLLNINNDTTIERSEQKMTDKIAPSL